MIADGYEDSINLGQGVTGNMDYYCHIFQIYKYKVTSFATVSQTVNGLNTNRKIGIEALGTWSTTTERQTAETTSLDIFAEYFDQPADSIWQNSSTADYGTIVFNQTKNKFYFYTGNETGFIYADTLGEPTAFDIDDEIFVLFE